MLRKIRYLIACSLLLSACTLTLQPVDTSVNPTSMPAPSVEISATEGLPLTDGEPGEEENAPTATEEIPLVEESPLASPWEQVSPQGGDLLLWYALPPQSPADQAFNHLVDAFNAQNSYAATVYAFNLSTPQAILSRTLPLLDTPDVPALITLTPQQQTAYGDSLLALDSLLDSPTWGIPVEQRTWATPLLPASPLPNIEGARYTALPIAGTATGLVYNSDWMARLGYYNSPESPQAFAALTCKAVQRPYRVDAQASGYAFVPSLDSLRAWTQIFGGSLYDQDVGYYRFDQQAVVQALDFLQGLYQRGCITLANDQAEAQTAFREGEALLILHSVDLLTPEHRWYKELSFNWQVDTLPGGTLHLLPPLALAIPRSTPERELSAWLFLRYALDTQVQTTFSEHSAWFPLQTGAVAQANLSARYKRLYKALLLSPPSQDAPLPPDMQASINNTLREVLQGASASRAMQSLQEMLDKRIRP